MAEDAVWADVVLPPRVTPRPLPGGVSAPGSAEVATGTDTQLVPDLVADGERAWLALISCGHEPAQGVLVATGGARGWEPPRSLAPQPARAHDQLDHQWRPRLAVTDGRAVCAHLAFPAESWDLFAAVEEPGGFSAPVRVDDADEVAGMRRERGHDAPVLLGDPGRAGWLTAVWSELLAVGAAPGACGDLPRRRAHVDGQPPGRRRQPHRRARSAAPPQR